MKSKYFNIAELLHNDLVARVAELLSPKTYESNVKSKYFNIAELLHRALVAMVAELLSPRTYVSKYAVKIL